MSTCAENCLLIQRRAAKRELEELTCVIGFEWGKMNCNEPCGIPSIVFTVCEKGKSNIWSIFNEDLIYSQLFIAAIHPQSLQ